MSHNIHILLNRGGGSGTYITNPKSFGLIIKRKILERGERDTGRVAGPRKVVYQCMRIQ
jgi:hypothetical protein